ncbi:MAG: methyltransferase domain-containing protein, partial [Thermoleophilaceae bacterium]
MTPRPLYHLPVIALRELRAEGPPAPRVPEPMVMDEPEGVAGFHAGGELNGLPAQYDLNARAMSALLPDGARLLDLGCGSGQYLAFLAKRRPDLTIVGLDLSKPMLETGREMLEREGLQDRVSLVECDITAVDDELASRALDLVSTVFTLHQLPDEDVLDGALRQIAALRERHGCGVWIFDFARLKDERTLPALFGVTEPDAPPVFRKDAIASERAGFTVEELDRRLEQAGLTDLESGHSRPIPMTQIRWAPA